MPYLKELRDDCQWSSTCYNPAKVELFNDVNESLGKFCRQHGQERLRVIRELERRRREGGG